MKDNEKEESSLRTILTALVISVLAITAAMIPPPPHAVPEIELLQIDPIVIEEAQAQEVEIEEEPQFIKTVYAHVTGYNSVPEQTDNTPCLAASGDDICGRTDVVACPRELPLGTKVQIDEKVYECLDRTATKFDGRYDISCDKDMECPYLVQGWKNVSIIK